MAGLLTPFPIIYIPVINQTVFRHDRLSWEWGLVAMSLVSFVALVEAWKAVKRRRLRSKMALLDNKSENSSIA